MHQVLREMWLFENEFQTSNFGQLRIFGGIKLVNKLFIKLLNLIKREACTVEENNGIKLYSIESRVEIICTYKE